MSGTTCATVTKTNFFSSFFIRPFYEELYTEDTLRMHEAKILKSSPYSDLV